MPRTVFERELLALQHEVLALGIMVEKAILTSVDILKRRDLEAAHKLIEADKELNEKRFAIEHQTLVTIATQQPMATDLRTLASVLRVQAALLLRGGEQSWAQLAAELDYVDQPHLTREFRRVAGLPPRALVEALGPLATAFVDRGRLGALLGVGSVQDRGPRPPDRMTAPSLPGDRR